MAPLVAYFAAVVLSVAVNGDVGARCGCSGVTASRSTSRRALSSRRTVLVDAASALARGPGPRPAGARAVEPAELLLLREDLRNTLVTDHPNSVGYTLAVLLPLFLGVALKPRGGALAKLYALAAPLGLLMTFSRSAWATAVLGVLVMALALLSSPHRAADRDCSRPSHWSRWW